MNPTSTSFGRRQFVAGAAQSFLGVTALSQLGTKAFAAGENTSPLKQVPTARNVIYLYMTGGMSHLDTWDPKPESDVMGLTKTIKTKVDGIRLSENIPLLARHADKLAILRGMNSTQGAHEQGNYYMHTSYTQRSSIRHPSMGAWLQKFQDRGNPTLPGSVMIGNDSRHPGAGFFESRFSPLMINDPASGINNVRPLDWFTEDRFASRLSLAKKLDQKFASTYDVKNVRAYSDMYDDAVKMMKSEELKAFDLDAEPDALREKYGRDSFGQGCLLARRLVEHGVRHVEVSFGNWDTHNANFTRVPELCDELDSAMSALIGDLEARGMLNETLVVLATEFGRTPEINANDGRDHHPAGFSCVMAGGGIRGGQIYGATDENGDKVVEGSTTIPDLNATIGYALGLPLDQVLYSPTKRPFTIADKGKPLTQLFG
ncbi:uncharacterized protein (DUF1501 family) [Prosthecobacter fusiformis]|uniref:Uncharacterized protein (DUF1501 family) n=1 Tax=Prosthecobacter fusiformis TaxID=48464 RepID=A0A4R7S396_9BACT|nr:DUF1501 domain-containing protein [Prosthecobacter fusiformis]TDU72862.1 uncharacterized protein (DUF1501 family) [Prosthecobacter fusiformis]